MVYGTRSTLAGNNNVSQNQQLYTWNKLLESGRKGYATNLWATYRYCVGVRAETKAQIAIQYERMVTIMLY